MQALVQLGSKTLSPTIDLKTTFADPRRYLRAIRFVVNKGYNLDDTISAHIKDVKFIHEFQQKAGKTELVSEMTGKILDPDKPIVPVVAKLLKLKLLPGLEVSWVQEKLDSFGERFDIEAEFTKLMDGWEFLDKIGTPDPESDLTQARILTDSPENSDTEDSDSSQSNITMGQSMSDGSKLGMPSKAPLQGPGAQQGGGRDRAPPVGSHDDSQNPFNMLKNAVPMSNTSTNKTLLTQSEKDEKTRKDELRNAYKNHWTWQKTVRGIIFSLGILKAYGEETVSLADKSPLTRLLHNLVRRGHPKIKEFEFLEKLRLQLLESQSDPKIQQILSFFGYDSFGGDKKIITPLDIFGEKNRDRGYDTWKAGMLNPDSVNQTGATTTQPEVKMFKMMMATPILAGMDHLTQPPILSQSLSQAPVISTDQSHISSRFLQSQVGDDSIVGQNVGDMSDQFSSRLSVDQSLAPFVHETLNPFIDHDLDEIAPIGQRDSPNSTINDFANKFSAVPVRPMDSDLNSMEYSSITTTESNLQPDQAVSGPRFFANTISGDTARTQNQYVSLNQIQQSPPGHISPAVVPSQQGSAAAQSSMITQKYGDSTVSKLEASRNQSQIAKANRTSDLAEQNDNSGLSRSGNTSPGSPNIIRALVEPEPVRSPLVLPVEQANPVPVLAAIQDAQVTVPEVWTPQIKIVSHNINMGQGSNFRDYKIFTAMDPINSPWLNTVAKTLKENQKDEAYRLLVMWKNYRKGKTQVQPPPFNWIYHGMFETTESSKLALKSAFLMYTNEPQASLLEFGIQHDLILRTTKAIEVLEEIFNWSMQEYSRLGTYNEGFWNPAPHLCILMLASERLATILPPRNVKTHSIPVNPINHATPELVIARYCWWVSGTNTSQIDCHRQNFLRHVPRQKFLFLN